MNQYILRPAPVVCAIALLWPMVTMAQTSSSPSQPLPPTVDAQQLQRQQREAERLQRERDLLLAPPSNYLPPPPPAAPTLQSNAQFVLQSVDFGPSAFLSAAQLQALAARYVGKTVRFQDLGELVNEVNALYIARNQVFARAILPPQQIAAGRVRIDLVEAKASDIQITGQQRVDTAWLQAVLGAEQGATLDADAIDQRLAYFQKSSDARISLDTQPGADARTTALRLQVTEPATLSGSASLSSEGNDSTGRALAQAELRWFSPLGRGDRVALSLSKSKGATGLGLSWQVPLSARWGTRASMSLARGRTHVVHGPFATLDYRGQSDSENLQLSQPLGRYAGWAVDSSLGLAFTRSANSSLGLPAARGRQQQKTLGFSAAQSQEVRDFAVQLSWQQTLATAGATQTQDTRMDWGASWVERKVLGGLTLLRAYGQSSRSAAPLGAQSFSLGGTAALRAYAPSALYAPNGYALIAEWHRPVNEQLGFNVFAERGSVWGGGPRQSLSDWGAGLEWRLSKATSLTASAARTIGAPPAGSDRARAYLKLSVAF